MPYTAAAHERQAKLRRQEQRLIVVNWATLANNSIEAFTQETTLELFSTKGRRLRVHDGGRYRRLSGHEVVLLWNAIRTELDGLGCRLTCKLIETGLKAVGLIAPMPMSGSAVGS
jgi:hypothetical protein